MDYEGTSGNLQTAIISAWPTATTHLAPLGLIATALNGSMSVFKFFFCAGANFVLSTAFSHALGGTVRCQGSGFLGGFSEVSVGGGAVLVPPPEPEAVVLSEGVGGGMLDPRFEVERRSPNPSQSRNLQ